VRTDGGPREQPRALLRPRHVVVNERREPHRVRRRGARRATRRCNGLRAVKPREPEPVIRRCVLLLQRHRRKQRHSSTATTTTAAAAAAAAAAACATP
jgi:hypothetical protein